METAKSVNNKLGIGKLGLLALLLACLFTLAFILVNRTPNKPPVSSGATGKYLPEAQKKQIIAEKSVLDIPSISWQQQENLTELPKEITRFMPSMVAGISYNPAKVTYTTNATGYYVKYYLVPNQYTPDMTIEDIQSIYSNPATQNGWRVINSQRAGNFVFFELENPGFKVRISYLPVQPEKTEVEVEIVKK